MEKTVWTANLIVKYLRAVRLNIYNMIYTIKKYINTDVIIIGQCGDGHCEALIGENCTIVSKIAFCVVLVTPISFFIALFLHILNTLEANKTCPGTPECTGHGTCLPSGSCQCDGSWRGPECNQQGINSLFQW